MWKLTEEKYLSTNHKSPGMPCPSTSKHFTDGKISLPEETYNNIQLSEKSELKLESGNAKIKLHKIKQPKKQQLHQIKQIQPTKKIQQTKQSQQANTTIEQELRNRIKSTKERGNKMSSRRKLPQKNKEKIPILPEIIELPLAKRKPKKIVADLTIESESIIECNTHQIEPAEMIRKMKIIPRDYNREIISGSDSGMLFKVKADFGNRLKQQNNIKIDEPKIQKKLTDLNNKIDNKGVIQYMLSNKEFITKGWTMLPTKKIIRRMNIYKMVPANPKFDWFLRNRHKYLMFYENGQILAEIHEDGSGKWFYRNCNVALEHYISQDTSCGRRYVVYSSGEKDTFGCHLPVTVLACFDYLGNGVVYDHFGNERLKYNQSEGIVIDTKIGPPCRWKWHTLNDPPVLYPMFIDKHAKLDSQINKLLNPKMRENSLDDKSITTKEPNLEMVAIELDNFMKEKTDKLLQNFKPFNIQKKIFKINNQFSVKILDQSNIYLIFSDNFKEIKLNIGMQLISDEIIDTDTADVVDVATPYDWYPPKSQSIANIQNILEKSRKFQKSRKFCV
ncbi:hypothetical protein ACJJTC_000618 [Scirpophaga incertulas]